MPDAADADADPLGADDGADDPVDELAPRGAGWPLAPEAAPVGTSWAGAGARTEGTEGVETVGRCTGTGDGTWTGGGAGTGTGGGLGLGTETVGMVGVGSDGVETVGVGSDGVETVGVGSDGVETVGIGRDGVETVGTVRAGLECGWMPTSSTAKPDRIPQTATLRALPAKRLSRAVSPTRVRLQPPCMAGYRYPSLMTFNRTQFGSIKAPRRARDDK